MEPFDEDLDEVFGVLPKKHQEEKQGSLDYGVYQHMVIELKTEVYRRSKIGRALVAALEEMTDKKKLNADLANIVLDQFDRTLPRRLDYIPHHIVFHAEQVEVYSLIGDDWRVKLKNVIVSDTEYEIGEFDSCVIFASKPVEVRM